jgi:uncharacterized protein YndB with AHSA1/START domain
MSDAVLVTGGTRPSVRLERQLADPPEVVWRAITDRDELRRWFPCDVDVEGGTWKVGAGITFAFPSNVIEMTLTGEVLAVDEPHALAYTWGDDVLRFELSGEAGGTRLVLVNELAAGTAARNAAGWDECLDRLEGIQPLPNGWQPRFERYTATFEPLVGPQQGPPAGYKGGD